MKEGVEEVVDEDQEEEPKKNEHRPDSDLDSKTQEDVEELETEDPNEEEEEEEEQSEEEQSEEVESEEEEIDEEEKSEEESEEEEQEDVASLSNKECNGSRTGTEEASEASEAPRSQQGCSLSSGLPWDDHPLLLSVVLLTMKLLKDCNALQKRSQEAWVAQGHRIINKTMAGVTQSEGLSPDDKDFRKVRHSVVATLEKRFGSKRMLDSVILLEHPEMEAVIVECLQSHVEDESAWLAGGGRPCPRCRLRRRFVASAAVGTAFAATAAFLCLYIFL